MNAFNAITADHVRDVLRQLFYDRTPGPTPLAGLTIVQRSLDRAGFRPTDAACRCELGRLITEIVETELDAWRHRLEVPANPRSVDHRARIVADFAAGHRELEGWSAIYYLFLRPDLDFSLHDLADLLPYCHRRTVQRRLQRGVDALTARLIALERAAVAAERRARLVARLPRPPDGGCFGIESLLDSLTAGLPAAATAAPLLALGGPGGIGKTALAWRLAERSIDGGGIDEVTWIRADGGAGLSDGPALEAMLGRRRHLVVIDALDDPELAGAIVAPLLRVPGGAPIILTGRIGWAGWAGVRAIQVPVLREAVALDLLRHEARARGLDAVARARAQTLGPLLAATAGHPQAIRLAVAQLRAADLAGVAADFALGRGAAATLCHDLWAPTWARTSPAAQAAVRTVVAGRRAGLTAAALREAVDAGLLMPEGAQVRSYRPALFLRRFLARLDGPPEVRRSRRPGAAQSPPTGASLTSSGR